MKVEKAKRKKVVDNPYNVIGELKKERDTERLTHYLENDKPRQDKQKKMKVVTIMGDYRNHLCDLHTVDGIRKCITTKCPLSGTSCYNYASFGDFYCSQQSITKRRIKKSIKEAMQKENLPDWDKL